MRPARATVEIFGHKLGLRSVGDPARLQELARYVDYHMRKVADQTSSVDTVRIAFLTALNIADELYKERESDQDGRLKQLEMKAERLVLKLEEVLETGETREGRIGTGGPCAVGDG